MKKEEVVKNQVCKVDINFAKKEAEMLMQSPDVQKLIYWQQVIQNAEEVEVNKTYVKKDETKSTSK